MDSKIIDNKNNENIKIPKQTEKINYNTCVYGEICSKEKMCGDCCADSYDRDQYQKKKEDMYRFWENFNIDRKMGEFKGRR